MAIPTVGGLWIEAEEGAPNLTSSGWRSSPPRESDVGLSRYTHVSKYPDSSSSQDNFPVPSTETGLIELPYDGIPLPTFTDGGPENQGTEPVRDNGGWCSHWAGGVYLVLDQETEGTRVLELAASLLNGELSITSLRIRTIATW